MAGRDLDSNMNSYLNAVDNLYHLRKLNLHKQH